MPGVGVFSPPWAGLLTPAACPRHPSSAQKLSNPAAVGSPLEHLHHDSGHDTWGGFPGQGWVRIFCRELPRGHSSAHTHRTRRAPGTKAAALAGQGNRRLPPAPSSSPQLQPPAPAPQPQPPSPQQGAQPLTQYLPFPPAGPLEPLQRLSDQGLPSVNLHDQTLTSTRKETTNSASKQPSMQVKSEIMSIPGNVFEFISSSLCISPISTEKPVVLGDLSTEASFRFASY